MSKTNDLKKEIVKIVKKLGYPIYFQTAPDTAVFPYVVFSFDNMNLGDSAVDVIICIFNVWDKSESYYVADGMADALEKSFDCLNSPSENILPTFYRETRRYIPDEDHEIKHVELKILLRNAERSR